jgi:hypothetical protein
MPKGKILELLHFRGYVVEALILVDKTARKKRGRPAHDAPSPAAKKKMLKCVP